MPCKTLVKDLALETGCLLYTGVEVGAEKSEKIDNYSQRKLVRAKKRHEDGKISGEIMKSQRILAKVPPTTYM